MFGAPTDYFRTWWNLDRYYDNSIFLPYINNERDPTSAYKENMQKLDNFGLWMWDDDEVVHPRQSEWFGFYNKNRIIVDVYETALYRDDLIGLKTLKQQNKLFFYHGPGIHMYLTPDMINLYLVPMLLGETPAPSQH